MSDFNPGKVRAKLRLVSPKARAGANRGLLLGAQHLLRVARQQVPHEEGVLEDSGKVSTDTQRVESAVSFDTPYAVRQHEDLSAKHDEGRKAKYLEDPMNTEAPTIRQLVGREVRTELSK